MEKSMYTKAFKFIGDLEGISYLVLLGIAMPLKYWAHNPLPVKITGAIHGGLFVLFVFAILACGLKEKWTIQKMALAFIASLLPLGTFLFNKKML
jgi:integral membrane protein